MALSFNRYLVFSYSTYYPEGGMNDCVLKTNDRDLAIRVAVEKRDDFYNFSVYDVLTGSYVLLPDEED